MNLTLSISIKDILFVPGWPTYFGSKLEPAPPSNFASPCVARLLEHNAILVGKTTTPDHGWCGVTVIKDRDWFSHFI